MKLRTKLVSAVLGLAVTCAAPAGALEDLLANPAIQSFLARQGDLRAALARCGDPWTRQQYPQLCQQADDANRLATMPPELRALMANPNAGASLRDICMSVQGTSAQESYLCAELFKADSAFAQQARALRYQRNEATRDRP